MPYSNHNLKWILNNLEVVDSVKDGHITGRDIENQIEQSGNNLLNLKKEFIDLLENQVSNNNNIYLLEKRKYKDIDGNEYTSKECQ